MSQDFHVLVRFKDAQGRVRYGEAPGDSSNLIGTTVPVYEGEHPWSLSASKEKAEIKEVLCPLAQVPIFYGIGLNYKKHIAESGFPEPQYPVVFTKPPDALAGPSDDIPINPLCENLDYEGELSIVIGRTCKNLPADADPLDYVLGFTVGNDVSSRHWQVQPQSGNQHGYAKSFDKFAPIGPVIVSPRSPTLAGKFTDGTPDIRLTTHVNGEPRQDSGTGDLLFGVKGILHHLSRATTLRPGTVIMSGTPSGVAAFMKPPAFLKNGDTVRIEIEGIGAIENKMVFE